MVRRIIEHNRLNGVVFSTIEFLFVAAAAAFIGLALALQKEWIGMTLAAGTTLNCLVVVAFGVAAWRRGERGNSLRSLFDSQHRQTLRREHPALMRDTLTLATAVLVPYLLLIAVALERPHGTS